MFQNKTVPARALEANLLYEVTRRSLISHRPRVAVDISTPRVSRSVEKMPVNPAGLEFPGDGKGNEKEKLIICHFLFIS